MASGRPHMYGDVTGHVDWVTLCSAVDDHIGIVRMGLCHGRNFDQLGLQRRCAALHGWMQVEAKNG